MNRNAPITYGIGQPTDTSQCLGAKDGEILQIEVRPNTTPDFGPALKPGVLYRAQLFILVALAEDVIHLVD